MLDAARFVNLFCQAFFAGSMNWVLLVTMPALKRMSERESVRTHQTQFDDLPDRFLPALGVTSTFAALAVVVFADDLSTASTILYVVGIVAMTIVGGLTLFINVPTNRMIRHWSADAIPPEYPRIRRRWNRVHATRVGLAALALGCYIAATLHA